MFDKLRGMQIFASCDDYEIQVLVEHGTECSLANGEALFYEGDPARGLYILLEGSLKVSKRVGDQELVLANAEPGSFVGEISLLTGEPHMASVRATGSCKFLKYEATLFDAFKSSPVAQLLLSTMSERLRHTESLVQQHEKLAALGKLSAGLAHELNNPASANLRAAKQLPDTLAVLQTFLLKLNQLGLNSTQMEYLIDFQATVMERASSPMILDPLTQSDREEDLAGWMDQVGVVESWKIAPMLVKAGLEPTQLETLHTIVGDAPLNAVLTWLESLLTVNELLRTIEHSSTRIFELIKAVKGYSYMDQTPIQDVNIHDGLENTLLILGHKLKNVVVKREYDKSLPRITVYGSELNQVWTNLIDNAVDAMSGKGQLCLRTASDEGRVLVEIIDSGPGILPEIQTRIFEPFFTTKAIGEGSGLGLDIAYRIVVERHHGNIRLESEPGRTCFQIYLPLLNTTNRS